MTSALERAISEVQNLPEVDQNSIADLILAELEDRKQWDKQFADTQEGLRRAAEKVRADIKAGKIRQMGIDEL
jgi:hypothetical protein